MDLTNVKLKRDKEGMTVVDTIIHEPKPCEDCGQTVTDRRVEYRHNHSSITVPHFKVECKICRRFKNPETGAFDMDRKEIDNYWRRTAHKNRK